MINNLKNFSLKYISFVFFQIYTLITNNTNEEFFIVYDNKYSFVSIIELNFLQFIKYIRKY